MGGAHVFPGGRVDDADHTSDADTWCDGVDAAIARLSAYAPAQAIAFYIAATRELFEEAGVLLARDSAGLVATDEGSAPRFATLRREMSAHRLTMRQLAEGEGVRLALDALVPFAHWVTPQIETRRFDTHFFFAVAPEAQQAAHDDEETTEGSWMLPAEALERCREGAIALPPPTWTTLRALGALTSVDDALAWAMAQSAPRVQPHVIERDDATRIIALPGDPLCPAVAGFEPVEKRFILSGGRWRPIDPD